MYVSDRIASNATGDSLAYLSNRATDKAGEKTAEAASTAHLAGGSHDPSAQVSLSVEALLVLSGTREDAPALSETERRATPISAIFQPGKQDFENAARVNGRISRATSMYSLGF